MDISIFMAGLGIGLSLIVAIGAQNAFVLRQGLKGDFVFAVCLACAVSDAVLIALGVTGFGAASKTLPWLEPILRYGGAAFLLWYGAKSLYSAFRSDSALVVVEAAPKSLWRTLVACLAFTWLNPHVYLDTVVFLGAISTQYAGDEAIFAAGAMTGSFVFFFALGYGARWLRPLFAMPLAWRLLEGGIAVIMLAIAAKLLVGP